MSAHLHVLIPGRQWDKFTKIDHAVNATLAFYEQGTLKTDFYATQVSRET